MTAVYIGDPQVAQRVRAEREANGDSEQDEVWEGVYFVPPSANIEHQDLATRLAGVWLAAMDWRKDVRGCIAVNVSDRETDWRFNYRVPDVSVILPGSRARDCQTHFLGGPDLILEILSQGDRSHEKLPFYAAIGVREALFLDREPWGLELYKLENNQLVLQGRVTPGQPTLLESSVLPVSFRMAIAEPQPRIEVLHQDSVRQWSV